MQTLSSQRLALRSYDEGLRDQFLTWMANDRDAESFLSKSFVGRPAGGALFEAFVQRSNLCQATHRVWAIVEIHSGALVGHVEGKATRKTEGDELELVYAVSRRAEGRGIATEAVGAVKWTLGACGVPLVAFISPSNMASRRVLQKTGFRLVVGGPATYGEKWTSTPLNG